jgi:hypothetical protein
MWCLRVSILITKCKNRSISAQLLSELTVSCVRCFFAWRRMDRRRCLVNSLKNGKNFRRNKILSVNEDGNLNLVKVKVNFTVEQTVKSRKGSWCINLSSLTSALDRGGLSALYPSRFTPWKRPRTRCIGGWVGPRDGLELVRKISPPTGFDPRTVQPVASRYTDWAIATQVISVWRSKIELAAVTSVLCILTLSSHVMPFGNILLILFFIR